MYFKLLSVVAQIARDSRRPEFGNFRTTQNRGLVEKWIGLLFGDAARPLALNPRLGRHSGDSS
jgi:hypothetical protein